MGFWQGTGHSRVFCLGREVNPKEVRLPAQVELRSGFLCIPSWRTAAVIGVVHLSGS